MKNVEVKGQKIFKGTSVTLVLIWYSNIISDGEVSDKEESITVNSNDVVFNNLGDVVLFKKDGKWLHDWRSPLGAPFNG